MFRKYEVIFAHIFVDFKIPNQKLKESMNLSNSLE